MAPFSIRRLVMLIDVVIPVRDVVEFLDAAIESALTQQDVDVFITVIDAGSRQKVSLSEEHASSQNVRLIRSEEPLTIGAARNLGVASTTRTHLAFLDADDIWPIDRSVRLLQAMRLADAEIAFGMVRHFSSSDCPMHVPEGVMKGFLAGASLMSRMVFKSVGPFRTDFRVGEFVDWMSRLKRTGIPFTVTDDLALLRRVHVMSTTALASRSPAESRQDTHSDYLKIVRSWMNL